MKTNLYRLTPVLFGFFIMGFCDIVGISVSYVQRDFTLSDTASNLLTTMVFLWFLIFSLPSAMLMNRIGRKKTVLLAMIITVGALLIPMVEYSFATILTAFALIGIGNTILQVSLNPLLSSIVAPDKMASSLTTGQFIKAISSFCGPLIAAFAAAYFGNWLMMFPLFAGITLVSALWLIMTPVERVGTNPKQSSFKEITSLLGERYIFTIFIGVFLIVGIDVGMNTTIPKLLMERTATDIATAGWGTSLYFACRTAGTFLGAILLARYSVGRTFRASMIGTIVGIATLIFAHDYTLIMVAVGLVGLSAANIFSILFSYALGHKPEYANEISGLMIMGVVGGAIVPPIMGYCSDLWGQGAAIAVLLLSALYLLYISVRLKTK